jgi:Copper amine oxidase N-terminal domain
VTYRLPTIQTLALTAVLATMAAALLAFSRPVEMVVDGQHVVSDVPPVTTPSDVYVPIRSLGDALGAQIDVVDRDLVYVIRGNESLRLKVGDRRAKIDGMPMTLAHPPFRVRGRVMVSLRAVARAFHVQVSYNARTARIDVMTPGVGQASSAAVLPHAQ